MNKLLLAIVGTALIIVATGCGSVFGAIPKDTVMIKKVNTEQQLGEAEYEGVLSQDAVKTLSLNAVNTMFGMHMTLDELRFELTAIDRNQFKELLSEAEKGTGPRPVQDPERKPAYEADLNPITDGLYNITLTRLSDAEEAYDIVLNAKDGNILKVSRTGTIRDAAGSSESAEEAQVIETAAQFIRTKGDYPLSELSLNKGLTRWGNIVALYYTNKDNDQMLYSIMVDLRRNEVVGFSKDVMALLSYYSRL